MVAAFSITLKKKGEPNTWIRPPSFQIIAEAKPPGGLGLPLEEVEALLAEAQTPKAVDSRDEKNQRPAGRPPKPESDPEIVDNVHNNVRPSGNSQSRALRRLRKSRPDLHAKVLGQNWDTFLAL